MQIRAHPDAVRKQIQLIVIAVQLLQRLQMPDLERESTQAVLATVQHSEGSEIRRCWREEKELVEFEAKSLKVVHVSYCVGKLREAVAVEPQNLEST